MLMFGVWCGGGGGGSVVVAAVVVVVVMVVVMMKSLWPKRSFTKVLVCAPNTDVDNNTEMTKPVNSSFIQFSP